jgi:rfaE bifunctional protein nucleotidyltransferase chain/domain
MGDVVSPQVLLETLTSLRKPSPNGDGASIITTNGCFDLLHVGHLRYLQACKNPATTNETLVVLLNSDDSIRRLKGPLRPIVPQDDRAELLAGLGCVDFVVLFEEDTPEKLLEVIRPDFHAKGAQYTEETLPEMPLLRSLGTQVRFVAMVENRSTTNLVEIIRERFAAPATEPVSTHVSLQG